MLYTTILVIHLICAICFIGSVFFWTFILSSIKNKIPNFDEVETRLSAIIIPTMRVIVGILGLTGLALFHYKFSPYTLEFNNYYDYALVFKGLLGLFMVTLFYIVSFRINKIKSHNRLHFIMISIMTLIIVLAKLI